MILTEVLDFGRGALVSQKLLGCDDYHRLSEWQPHMCPEQLEVIGCVGRHDHGHVDGFEDVLVVVVFTIVRHELILITEQEVSLSACGRVLRTLPIVTGWQKHNESVFHIPFGFS